MDLDRASGRLMHPVLLAGIIITGGFIIARTVFILRALNHPRKTHRYEPKNVKITFAGKEITGIKEIRYDL